MKKSLEHACGDVAGSCSEKQLVADLPFVSVIIPILDDYKRLGLCLQALAQQSYPAAHFEVILVDNGTDPSRIVDYAQKYDFVRQIVEPRKGSYAARNAGLKQAQGEVIAFTDSDCIPRPNWLIEGVNAVTKAKSIGLVAGGIEVFAADSSHPTLAELYELEFAFPQQQYAEVENYGATANMFSRRDIFESVGIFDSSLRSGGDHEWGQRVARSGLDVVFAETAIVAHPARQTLEELRQKMWRTHRAYHERFWTRAGGFQRAAFLLRLVRNSLPPVRFIVRTISSARPWQEKISLIAVRSYYLYVSKLTRLRLVVQEIMPGGE